MAKWYWFSINVEIKARTAEKAIEKLTKKLKDNKHMRFEKPKYHGAYKK